MIAVGGILILMPVSYAQMNTEIPVNADSNAEVHTSMNGNTSTSAGVPVSSTASSSESRSVTGER